MVKGHLILMFGMYLTFFGQSAEISNISTCKKLVIVRYMYAQVQYAVVSRKRGSLWIIHPPPQFCLDFLLRSKTHLKERPHSRSIANRGIPIVWQTWGCGEIGLHTLQAANYTAGQWFTPVQCKAQCHTLFALLCTVHNTDVSNVGPPPAWT